MYLRMIKEKAVELYGAKGDQAVPCTTAEVEELEAGLGHRLPKAYQEFLLWMGHSGGEFLQGSDCFYHDLKNLSSYARELLQEDHFPGELPEEAFVFFMHQGYQFNFFLLEAGDDPPVYYYLEEIPVRTAFYQTYARFSDFLLAAIEGHIRIKEEMRARILQRKAREEKMKYRNDISSSDTTL